MDRIDKRIGSFVMGRFRYPSFVGIATQLANPAPTNWTPRGNPCSSMLRPENFLSGSSIEAQITYQPNGKHQWQFQTRIRQRPIYPIDLRTIRLSREQPFAVLDAFLRCGVTHKAMEGCGPETG
jgi:hypothetical protein